MDEAFKKISRVFGGKKGFKGQGHRLGTNEDNPSKDRKPVPDRQKAGSTAPSNGRRSTEPAAPSNQAAKPIAFTGSPQRLGSADPAPPQPTARREQAAPASTGSATAHASNSGSSTAQPPQQAQEAAVAEASKAVAAAVAQLRAGSEEPRSVVGRLLANIARDPADARFRRVRLGNPRIQAAVVDAEGGLELLQACGFQIEVAEAADGSPADAFAVLPEGDDNLAQVRAALSLLGPPTAAAAAAPATVPATADAAGKAGRSEAGVPAASSGPCDRQTQVLLPSAPEGAADVPDWVFKRTPAELKAAMQEARRKREQSEVLMTRAMREKLRLSQQPPQQRQTRCTVRVRLPEGLLLQGSFNADEPVAAVFDWVTDCLADPGATYDLVLPDRKPLVTAMGTLRSAQLLPKTLLMLRFIGRASAQEQLTVRRDLLVGPSRAAA